VSFEKATVGPSGSEVKNVVAGVPGWNWPEMPLLDQPGMTASLKEQPAPQPTNVRPAAGRVSKEALATGMIPAKAVKALKKPRVATDTNLNAIAFGFILNPLFRSSSGIYRVNSVYDGFSAFFQRNSEYQLSPKCGCVLNREER